MNCRTKSKSSSFHPRSRSKVSILSAWCFHSVSVCNKDRPNPRSRFESVHFDKRPATVNLTVHQTRRGPAVFVPLSPQAPGPRQFHQSSSALPPLTFVRFSVQVRPHKRTRTRVPSHQSHEEHLQAFITSSSASFASLSSCENMFLNNRIHRLVCRNQFQGVLQSSNSTTRVSGSISGVNNGFSNGENAWVGDDTR